MLTCRFVDDRGQPRPFFGSAAATSPGVPPVVLEPPLDAPPDEMPATELLLKAGDTYFAVPIASAVMYSTTLRAAAPDAEALLDKVTLPSALPDTAVAAFAEALRDELGDEMAFDVCAEGGDVDARTVQLIATWLRHHADSAPSDVRTPMPRVADVFDLFTCEWDGRLLATASPLVDLSACGNAGETLKGVLGGTLHPSDPCAIMRLADAADALGLDALAGAALSFVAHFVEMASTLVPNPSIAVERWHSLLSPRAALPAGAAEQRKAIEAQVEASCTSKLVPIPVSREAYAEAWEWFAAQASDLPS